MIRLRILAACSLCAVFTACDSPRTPLDTHDVGVSAQQLESIAGEAGLLAQQLAARHIPVGMAWVHQQALGEDVLKAAQELGKPAPEQLRAAQQRVAALAAQLQVQLTRIAPAADRPDELDALQREFRAIATSLHSLAERA